MTTTSGAPAAQTPCSSNGDAAESLRAMFAKAPDPFAEPTDISDADAEKLKAPSKADNAAWRLKFLHKVGVPPKAPQAANEDIKADAPTPPPSGSSSEADGGGGVDDIWAEDVKEAPKGRSEKDIRSGYIKKLENSRAFIPQLNRPKQSQTVTIFDWDDTLLCTSHLEMVQRQFGAIPSQVREQLASLERIVKTLLQQAIQNGKAFIITNASEGWVQHSSSLCMPGLAEDLAKVCARARRVCCVCVLCPARRSCRSQCRHCVCACAFLQVDILSARGAFEASFPGDSHAWKMHAFLQVQNKLQLEAVTNLISVGDSHIEMDAVHLLGRSFAHALVKTVKLWERPTPYELQKQLEVVADKLPDIYRAGTTLNIWLERETAAGGGP